MLRKGQNKGRREHPLSPTKLLVLTVVTLPVAAVHPYMKNSNLRCSLRKYRPMRAKNVQCFLNFFLVLGKFLESAMISPHDGTGNSQGIGSKWRVAE
jgi:hypothetical protein